MTGKDRAPLNLTVHEQARSALDAKAVALKQQLGPVRIGPRPATWTPDVHTTAISKSDLVGPASSRAAGPTPHVVNVVTGPGMGLAGPAATEFDKLCAALHRAIQPRRTVDLESVRHEGESWLLQLSHSTGFTEHCLRELQQLLKVYDVFVPIRNLHTQSPIHVGEVVFEELSAATIERWHRSPGYASVPDADKHHVDAFFTQFAKLHRGHAVARVRVRAVRNQAVDDALHRAEVALGLLRFFAPAAFLSELRSTCVPFGRERKEEFVAVLESASVYEGMQSGTLDGEVARPWFINNDDLTWTKGAGLELASRLLGKLTRTPFEDAVLSSIALYSESTLERRAHIRLLLIFSALEVLFLANDSEPIVASLRCRLTVAVEPPRAEWAKVRGLIDSVYHKRSAFVHHGVTLDIGDIQPEFFEIAWTSINFALLNATRFPTVADFVKVLDTLGALGT